MLYSGFFKVVKEYATQLLGLPGHTTDVDRINLILCKRRAQRALSEDYDDHNLERFASLLHKKPHPIVQTYLETFPSANNSLEAEWLKVAADLCTARQQKHQEANDESIEIWWSVKMIVFSSCGAVLAISLMAVVAIATLHENTLRLAEEKFGQV